MKPNWICTEDDYDRQYVLSQLAKHTKLCESGCIEWTGGLAKDGYGILYATRRPNRRKVGAHRAAWLVHRGDIPSGLLLDHLCRNPLCVNVEHMEIVTFRVNALRGILGAKRGHGHHGRQLHSCGKHQRENGYIYTNKVGDQRWVCRICRNEATARYKARTTP